MYVNMRQEICYLISPILAFKSSMGSHFDKNAVLQLCCKSKLGMLLSTKIVKLGSRGMLHICRQIYFSDQL